MPQDIVIKTGNIDLVDVEDSRPEVVMPVGFRDEAVVGPHKLKTLNSTQQLHGPDIRTSRKECSSLRQHALPQLLILAGHRPIPSATGKTSWPSPIRGLRPDPTLPRAAVPHLRHCSTLEV